MLPVCEESLDGCKRHILEAAGIVLSSGIHTMGGSMIFRPSRQRL